ncbi:MAG: DUF4032 domain-containing protein [Microthrixaceae bacterium]|nr:DUF4032 domain-containing protein [Microthrixaceae bacterium]
MVAFTLKTTLPQADLLALPWDLALEDWPKEATVILPAGNHRHVVRFVPTADDFVALKELPHHLALREFEVLSTLHRNGLPAVGLIGIASARRDRAGDPLPSILITKHLRYSLPYAHLFAAPGVPSSGENLVNALTVLLVRLHLDGVFWGDCSLNNALFRRDAGALRAYVVDTETAELHSQLSRGQRMFDLQIAVENLVGGLLDIEASGRLQPGIDPFATGEHLDARYRALWDDLTQTQAVGESHLASIHQRLARLNELGFDTDEVQLDAKDGLIHFRPTIVEEGHHKRQLAGLTGITAHENQARRLLSAIRAYGVWIQDGPDPLPDAVVASRWLRERWEPTMAQVPASLRGRLEDAELYHEVLEHGWALANQEGRDVPLADVVDSYLRNVLEHHADGRLLITPQPDDG